MTPFQLAYAVAMVAVDVALMADHFYPHETLTARSRILLAGRR